ncbi:proto-oncogene tyrosine-protein kinase ROS-like [Formica exsecta]|uniref:proto-oncogene tyrosine-protein kinase ROS-like n=1 Tax=Formica exsecta TaxID=72781 RepID=UPI0011430D2F|nr:proto-oncogene tyrosine-protein kinase ROS-like [Formica exsecta]
MFLYIIMPVYMIVKILESILSKPASPRAFVEFHNGFLNEENDIFVTFRWNQPEFTDEVIQGYTVQCWFIKNQKEIQICNNKSISPTILECTVHHLKSNMIYYFQVRAHTKVGAGPYTDLINVSTTHENPIPQLLMVTKEGIDIRDLDSKINVNLVKDMKVTSAIYSRVEHKIYWSNEERKLMMLKINKNNITKTVKLQNIARNLCIDWVARNLYWIDLDKFHIHNAIIKLDLTMWENGIVKYDKVLKLEPFLSNADLILLPSIGYVNLTLYWTNTIGYDPQTMQSDLDGKNARIFQENRSVMTRFRFMKIDINTKKPLIYWLRMKVGQLHAKVVLALLLRDYEMWQTKENESFLDPR